MEIVIQSNKRAAELLCARTIAQALQAKPDLVLGLATGRTMESVYAELARLHRDEGLNFAACRTFNLDEYVGLAGSHPQSYRHFMNQHLFSKVNIPLANTRLPDGTARDIPAECTKYEAEIKAVGGIDLQLLGIGSSGHIGFNEPMSAIYSRTRIKTLTPETIAQNGPLFGAGEPVPIHALTMGVGTILESKRCLVLVTGAAKSRIVQDAFEGPISTLVTGSALQLHAHTIAILDEDAASYLKLKDYYRWAYANKPDWQKLA